jgi:hypothetical protein
MEDLITDDSFTQKKEPMKPMRKVFHVYIYPFILPFSVANFALDNFPFVFFCACASVLYNNKYVSIAYDLF